MDAWIEADYEYQDGPIQGKVNDTTKPLQIEGILSENFMLSYPELLRRWRKCAGMISFANNLTPYDNEWNDYDSDDDYIDNDSNNDDDNCDMDI